jgi:hypothetical protein
LLQFYGYHVNSHSNHVPTIVAALGPQKKTPGRLFVNRL